MFHYEDISEHPFSPENRRYESGEPDATEACWLRWVKDAEKLLGLTSLDGDEDTDGYSLDAAYDWWEKKETPTSYAQDVNRKRHYLGLALLS